MDRNEPFCIFCKLELDNSDEHIIPQSVNGTLHSTKLICHACNSKFFGRHIDPVIKIMLNPLISMLGWDNATPFKAEDLDSGEYVVSTSFSIRPIRPVKQEFDLGGKKLLRIVGDPKNAPNMFKKEVERLKEQGKVMTALAVDKLEYGTPFIRAKWELTITPELILLLNKITVEFYAYNGLPYDYIEDICQRVRGYDLALANVTFCNQRNEVRDFRSDEVSHLIVLKNDPDTNTLFAYLEIFNLICCTVVLSEEYHGPDPSYYYHQDALTGERFTEQEPELKMGLPEMLTYHFQHDNFQYLNNSLVDRIRTRDFNAVTTEQLQLVMDELQGQVKQGLVPESDLPEIFVQRSAEVLAHLTVYHFPYIIEDQDDEENDEYNLIHSNVKKRICG